MNLVSMQTCDIGNLYPYNQSTKTNNALFYAVSLLFEFMGGDSNAIMGTKKIHAGW